MKNLFLSTIFLLATFSMLHAQEFYEGSCEYGLIKFSSPELAKDTTSSRYKIAIEFLAEQFKNSFSFTKDKIVFIKGESERVVFDYENNKIFHFITADEGTYYTLDTIDPNKRTPIDITKEELGEMGDPIFLKNYKFGFDCKKYVLHSGGSTSTYIFTEQIRFPEKSNSDSVVAQKSILVETSIEKSDGTKIVFGMTKFQNTVDDTALFSTDTKGFLDGALLKKTPSVEDDR